MRRGLPLLAAAALLLVPAVAARTGSTTHFLLVYKAEHVVAVDGHETKHATVSCASGGYVLDGMWAAAPSSIEVSESQSVTDSAATWRFTFSNHASAPAEFKVYAVCLGATTAVTSGHSHHVSVYRTRNVSTTFADGTTDGIHSHSCPLGELAVAPGFAFTHGSARPLGSYPTLGGRGWTWKVASRGGHGTFSIQCLHLATSVAQGHRHRIFWHLFPGDRPAGAYQLLPGTHEVHPTCGEDEKAAVGAYWLNEHARLLGTRPGPRTRAYVLHGSGDHSSTVHAGAVCLDDSVGRAIAP